MRECAYATKTTKEFESLCRLLSVSSDRILQYNRRTNHYFIIILKLSDEKKLRNDQMQCHVNGRRGKREANKRAKESSNKKWLQQIIETFASQNRADKNRSRRIRARATAAEEEQLLFGNMNTFAFRTVPASYEICHYAFELH